jgi:hypothetical protein
MVTEGAMTMTKFSAELPLESGAAGKFTEEQARQWLAERGDSSVRQLAKLWGWHPSKVQRYLSRVRSETPRETVSETPTVSADTPDTPDTPQGQGRVLGKTPSGTVVAAMPDASDLDDEGPSLGKAPYSDDFKWEPENGAVIVAQQQALAIYINRWGQIVIRAAGEDYGEDVFIRVSPEHVPALIARLSAILKDE